MARELPMHQPSGGSHEHIAASSLSIAIGGGQTLDGDGGPSIGRPDDGADAAPEAALRRHPGWIKARLPSGETYHDLRRLLRGLNLNTVCEEAHCPNIGECWDMRTATVMILGDVCSRACGFCAVKTGVSLPKNLLYVS